MPSLGGWEFVILIGILVLLFGAKKLPDMARSIGQSARVFKGEMKGLKSDEADKAAADKPAEPAPAAAPVVQPAAVLPVPVVAEQAQNAPQAARPGTSAGQ